MSELPGATFAAQIAAFQAKVERARKAIFVNTCSAAKASITDGSAVTGAPGQPVDTGFLKGSWQLVFESADSAIIGTNVSYAPIQETGVRSDFAPQGVDNPKPSQGPHRPSQVGGHHSVALTAAGFQRIVEAEALKVGG
jgi:hypothetical protein